MFHGEALARYAFPDPHPFGSDRLPSFWREFTSRGLEKKAKVEAPVRCTEEALLTFHTREYVERVRQASKTGEGFLDDGDTPAIPGIFEIARDVAGTTLAAVRTVMAGRFARAFSPVAGLHHARRGRAGGFCVVNDVGIAIEHLRSEFGVRRIGYVDIDAHHGDGVFYEYESDAEVFIGDIHEDGRYLYPGTGSASETGKGAAEGTKRNFPMMPYAGEKPFRQAFELIEGFLDSSRPEFVFFQCGADSLAGDPISHLNFTPACHRFAAERLRALADKHCGGRLVAMGGGGYDRKNLAQAWCEVVEALL